MLKKNLSVVFSHFKLDKDKGLMLYETLGDAQKKEACIGTVKGHYMTITGLYKYMCEDSGTYEYILKIVSWGDTYYVRYDEYSEYIDYSTNILRIN